METAARDLLRQKMTETPGTGKTAAPKPTPPPVAVHPAPAPQTTPVPKTPAQAASPTQPTLDPAAEAAARDLLRTKMTDISTAEKVAVAKPAPPPQPKSAAKPAPAVVEAAPAPEPSRPLTKMEKLAELNKLYFADKITPREYHQQRAKIIAEP